MRPRLHFTPRTGWMNDPNGLIHWRGRHHLFFQHNPHNTRFENLSWGHASSADLINWQEHPLALRPGEGGTAYDADGCFSGCAVAVDDGVSLLYTGVRGDMQLPCLAHSTDPQLETFKKDAANPVIAQRPPLSGVTAFRDHTLRHVDGRWRQNVGGGATDRGGCLFEYSSSDLSEWRFERVVADSTSIGIPGEIWECPDLFIIDGVPVLIVSAIHGPAHTVWWATGTLVDGAFVADHYGRLDAGDTCYAPQSYWAADGRRLMIAWLRTHLDPKAHGASRQGAMSLPWVVTTRAGQIHIAPAAEIRTARAQPDSLELKPGTTATEMPVANLSAAEVEVAASTVNAPHTVTLLDDRNGETLTIDLHLLSRPANTATSRETATRTPTDAEPFRIFFDCGLVEIFHGGRVGTWSQLGLQTLSRIRIEHTPATAAGTITAWPLDTPTQPQAQIE